MLDQLPAQQWRSGTAGTLMCIPEPASRAALAHFIPHNFILIPTHKHSKYVNQDDFSQDCCLTNLIGVKHGCVQQLGIRVQGCTAAL